MKEFLFGKLLSLYSPDVADYVQLRQPKSAVELANLVQDYLDTRTYWKDHKYSGRQYSGKDKQQYVNRDDSKLADGTQLKQVDTKGETPIGTKPKTAGQIGKVEEKVMVALMLALSQPVSTVGRWDTRGQTAPSWCDVSRHTLRLFLTLYLGLLVNKSV